MQCISGSLQCTPGRYYMTVLVGDGTRRAGLACQRHDTLYGMQNLRRWGLSNAEAVKVNRSIIRKEA